MLFLANFVAVALQPLCGSLNAYHYCFFGFHCSVVIDQALQFYVGRVLWRSEMLLSALSATILSIGCGLRAALITIPDPGSPDFLTWIDERSGWEVRGGYIDSSTRHGTMLPTHFGLRDHGCNWSPQLEILRCGAADSSTNPEALCCEFDHES